MSRVFTKSICVLCSFALASSMMLGTNVSLALADDAEEALAAQAGQAALSSNDEAEQASAAELAEPADAAEAEEPADSEEPAAPEEPADPEEPTDPEEPPVVTLSLSATPWFDGATATWQTISVADGYEIAGYELEITEDSKSAQVIELKASKSSYKLKGMKHKKVVTFRVRGIVTAVEPDPEQADPQSAADESGDGTLADAQDEPSEDTDEPVAGEWSDPVKVKTLARPVAPKKLKVAAGNLQAKLSWKKSATKQTVGYEISYCAKGSSNWKSKTVKNRSTKSAVVKKLNTKKWRFKVRTYVKGYGGKLYSKWSSTVKATPFEAYGFYEATQSWRVYDQLNDYAYVSLPLGGNVAGSGCGLCALSISCHLLDQTTSAKKSFKLWTPGKTMSKMRSYTRKTGRYVTTVYGTTLSNLKPFAQTLKIGKKKVKTQYVSHDAKSVLAQLKKGRVLIMESAGYVFRTEKGRAYSPGVRHIIMVYGYKNGVFYAKDSWGSAGGSVCKYTAKNLNKFFTNTRYHECFALWT